MAVLSLLLLCFCIVRVHMAQCDNHSWSNFDSTFASIFSEIRHVLTDICILWRCFLSYFRVLCNAGTWILPGSSNVFCNFDYTLANGFFEIYFPFFVIWMLWRCIFCCFRLSYCGARPQSWGGHVLVRYYYTVNSAVWHTMRAWMERYLTFFICDDFVLNQYFALWNEKISPSLSFASVGYSFRAGDFQA